MANCDYENEFIKKTREGMSESIDTNLIAVRGFDIRGIREEKEDCILVIGLNPAGDEKDAIREREDRTYLYSLGSVAVKKDQPKWFYNTYYRPIFDLAQSVRPDGAKWPWCNLDWKEIQSEIEGTELGDFEAEIKSEYEEHRNCRCTIYIGDMFYYHDKKSKRIPYKKEWSDQRYSEYCWDMLDMHIRKLFYYKKTVQFVYINSAKVSRWLCGEQQKTHKIRVVDGCEIPVFFGPMLSSGNTDLFSMLRLSNEIKQVLWGGKL